MRRQDGMVLKGYQSSDLFRRLQQFGTNWEY